MIKQGGEFFWGDRWCVENYEGWFVAGNINILFRVDMINNCYEIVAKLPDYTNYKFRSNSNCIKCNELIFCMPNRGECIWCYDLLDNKFSKIEIENPNCLEVGIVDFWRIKNILWAVSMGLKQIIKIDITARKIIAYYNITDCAEEVIGKSVKINNYIYSLSGLESKIYEFSLKTKQVKIIEFETIRDRFHTISICEGKIWLSGNKKRIYIWEKDRVRILDHFPENFGIYKFLESGKVILDCISTKYRTFTFIDSIIIGNYIWFIPFQTNNILYVDKMSNKINVFEIEGEDINDFETVEMNCRYVLQYVYNNRYIGLYSLKNKVIYEIDAITLEMKKRCNIINIKSLEENMYGWNFRERISVEKSLYKKLIERKKNVKNIEENIGGKIYDYMN